MTSWRQGNKEVKFSQINTFKRIKAWTKKKKNLLKQINWKIATGKREKYIV